MLVPARCWTSSLVNVTSPALFSLLGPLSRGQYVEQMVYGFSVTASSTITFGAVMGLAGAATVDAWRAGRPLIDRSGQVGDGQPVILERQFSNIGTVWPVWVGLRVTDGPAYIVWRAEVFIGTGALSGYASCRVLEEERERGSNGSERSDES